MELTWYFEARRSTFLLTPERHVLAQQPTLITLTTAALFIASLASNFNALRRVRLIYSNTLAHYVSLRRDRQAHRRAPRRNRRGRRIQEAMPIVSATVVMDLLLLEIKISALDSQLRGLDLVLFGCAA